MLKGNALADQIIDEIRALEIVEGPLRGQPFELLPWEIEFIKELCVADISALTIARGNGKTALIAAIATTAITPGGALYEPMRDTILVSASLTQAKVCFKRILQHISKRIDEDRQAARSQKQKNPWSVLDSTQKRSIGYLPDGTELHAIGCDPKLSHGFAAGLFIGDEPAQWSKGSDGEEMFNALKGALGKQEDARFVLLGTKAQDDMHWWSRLLKDETIDNRAIYAAEKDDPDFDIDVVRKANPSMDHIPSLKKQILDDLKRAQNGTEILFWRAQRLNKGTPEVEKFGPIVELEYWDDIVKPKAAKREGPVFVGIDFGGSRSMSAVCFYWPVSGRFEAHGALPKKPTLEERGKQDHVGDRYAEMYRRGELRLYNGYATNNRKFLADMMENIQGQEIAGMAADNWKKADLQQALSAAGLYHWYEQIDLRRVGHGEQGSQDVRAFQAEVLESASSDDDSGSIFHMEDNLLMRSAISEAIVVYDSNGNPKLDKGRQRGRIDALQAGVMSVSMGRQWRMPPEEQTIDQFWADMLESGQETVTAV